ncbi:UMP/CMP kinase b [Cladochytrium replicatum]|nr:UMP/CMP kinase b [Cladochytrium replicatum]
MGSFCSTPRPSKTVEPEIAPPQRTTPHVLFVLGGPASGKGTVCQRLISEYPIVSHVSAGDLLREEVRLRPDSDLSRVIQDCMTNGKLVTSETIIPLLLQRIKAEPVDRVILIDGFPRNLTQANEFESAAGLVPDAVIFLSTDEKTMLARLLGRAQDGSGRADDNEETAKKRFAVFYEESVPVVESYRARTATDQRTKLVELDAGAEKEDVYRAVLKGLKDAKILSS